MADEFQTSFIPKKTVEVARKPRKATSMNLLALGGIIIFILAILASVGVFGYQRVLKSGLVSKQKQLEDLQGEFELPLIRELVRLDQRFKSTDILLSNHIALSNLLAFIEEHTLETVQFSSFGVSRSAGEFRVNLSGVANGFASVALQSDEFGNNPTLQDVLFSSFNLEETGGVTFSVEMLVDPTLFEYEPPSVSIPVEIDLLDGDTDEDQEGEDGDVDNNPGGDVIPPEDVL